MAEWKSAHMDASGKAVDHELVVGVIEELIENLGVGLDGLPAYGIRKVARYAAAVARAQALGFDPNLLRITADEHRTYALELAEKAALLGIPVHIIESPEPGDSEP